MIRRPPRSTLDRSSAASDVYKRQEQQRAETEKTKAEDALNKFLVEKQQREKVQTDELLSLIHISEPTRPY